MVDFMVSERSGAAIAGLIGSVISMNYIKGMNAKQWAFSISSSSAMAYYLALPTADYFQDVKLAGPIGLLIGLFGISICAKIFDTIKTLNVSAILKARIGQ